MNSPTEWRPAGAMTIEHATALWADARSHAASSAVYVDLSAVDRLDTAGCQILLACRADARSRGAAWTLTGCGPQAIEVMRLLGCDDLVETATEETER